MPITETPTYTAECGTRIKEGERAYDYYSMKPGVIGKANWISGDDPKDRWFTFHHDDGREILLNGQRICSMIFARLRGFPGATSE